MILLRDKVSKLFFLKPPVLRIVSNYNVILSKLLL